MKRYSMTPVTRCGQTVDELQECGDGEWVSFEDYEALKNKLAGVADLSLGAEEAVKCIRRLLEKP